MAGDHRVLREAIRGAFRQVAVEAARHLWTCEDAEFIAVAEPGPEWWGGRGGGYFGPAYEAIAARFPGQDGAGEAGRTQREVDAVLHIAGAHFGEGPLRILDLPCGSGRHARVLAERGHAVVGMDLQESLLRRAGPVPCAAADMRRLPVAGGAFDLLLNLWNSFGYFDEEAEEIAALAEFRRVLRPGGLALLHADLDTRAVAEGRWVQHMKVPLGDGALFLVREVPAAARRGLVCLSWVVLPDEEPWQSPPFFLRVLDDGDWERLAAAAGYRALRISRTPPGAVPHESIVSLLA